MKSSLWKIPKIKNEQRKLTTENIINDLDWIIIDKQNLIQKGFLKDTYWNILTNNWLKPVANFNWCESEKCDDADLKVSKYYKKYSYEIEGFWKLDFLFIFREELSYTMVLPKWYQHTYTRSNSNCIHTLIDPNGVVVPDSSIPAVYQKSWYFWPEIMLIPTEEQKKKITIWGYKGGISCSFTANIDDTLWSSISKWLASFETKIKKSLQREMLAVNFWKRETIKQIAISEIDPTLSQKLKDTQTTDFYKQKLIKTNELKKDSIYSFPVDNWEMIFIPYWIWLDSQNLEAMVDTTIETMDKEKNIYGYGYLANSFWFWSNSLWSFFNAVASAYWISPTMLSGLKTKEPEYFRIPLFSDGKSLYFKETRTNNKIILEKRI